MIILTNLVMRLTGNMNRTSKFMVCFIIFLMTGAAVYAQKIATLELNVKKENQGTDLPVSIQLDKITFLPDSLISLVEVKNNIRRPVAYQLENKGERVLYWIVKPEESKSGKRIFELIRAAPIKNINTIKTVTDDGSLTIVANQKNLLRYNFKTMYPPKGVDTAFKRSGFIHPFWTPHGQALTRINAPDHYHHFGLWNPWTHVLFEGEMIDFWNLKDRKGTVRFASFTALSEGPVYAGYQTLHEHIAFKKNGEKKVALNELQTVRIYQPENNADYYIMDITIQLNCASDSPVILKEYRYGGLGWRATEKWNKDNSETLTSEGKNRKEADGSKARWVIVQGSLDQDYGGAVMMSYPSNYNYPEPLRIWPENSNGRGDVYANFSPTKDKDWPLEKGKDYVLKYRFLVYNGKYDNAKAEAAWQNFAEIPAITIKLNNSK
jgi:hypothetical protein